VPRLGNGSFMPPHETTVAARRILKPLCTGRTSRKWDAEIC
jgi:hypothetical protein